MVIAATLRPYLTVGLTLTLAGAIAVTPAAPQPAAGSVVQAAQLLSVGDSLMNIPLNLFQDLVNIPANEVQAMDTLAQSLLFTGPWFVGSPSNVWGEDPGDPGHFEGLLEMVLPFPVLTGAGHEADFDYPGLGQQLAMLAAVEIPADPSCESLDCLPAIPAGPITGLTWIDQALWSLMIITGVQKMPIIDDWFRIPFSDMMNGNTYYFDPATQAGLQDSGVAHDGFLWEGTRTLEQLGLNPADYPNVPADAPMMPWTGTHYAMDFQQPFTNFYDSLTAPFDPSKFELPDPAEFLRALQALAAGMAIDFTPFVPGSPLCPGPCLLLEPGGNMMDPADWNTPSYYLLAKAIGDLWPGNTSINEWLSAYADGTANVSDPDIIDYETSLWRLGTALVDLGNPLPPDPAIDTVPYLPTIDQIHDALGNYFFNIADNIGVLGPFDIQGLWDAVFNVTAPA